MRKQKRKYSHACSFTILRWGGSSAAGCAAAGAAPPPGGGGSASGAANDWTGHAWCSAPGGSRLAKIAGMRPGWPTSSARTAAAVSCDVKKLYTGRWRTAGAERSAEYSASSRATTERSPSAESSRKRDACSSTASFGLSIGLESSACWLSHPVAACDVSSPSSASMIFGRLASSSSGSSAANSGSARTASAARQLMISSTRIPLRYSLRICFDEEEPEEEDAAAAEAVDDDDGSAGAAAAAVDESGSSSRMKSATPRRSRPTTTRKAMTSAPSSIFARWVGEVRSARATR